MNKRNTQALNQIALKYYIVFLLILLVKTSGAQKLIVKLWSNTYSTTAIFAPLAGDYKIRMDTIVLNLENSTDVYQLSVEGDSIEVKTFEKSIGKCKKIIFNSLSKDCSFKLKSVTPDSKVKIYDDDLEASVIQSGLKLLNKVDIEDYVAGVVESEGGPRNSSEYYKLQAILCRTYSLNNMRKHEVDSFNLCDQVHCQAYKGKTNNTNILNAVYDTKGLVIVDDDLNLISATFHSNCGGQTVNSEDVWLLSASYLRSVKDTFCLRMPNAKWQKKIEAKDWLNYLSSKFNFPVSDSLSTLKALSYAQANGRELFFIDKYFNIPLKTIRTDMQLKSTYFSLEQGNDSVIFNGRGYGHGVGLCQEGAMRMAQYGISFKEIINFYYTKVHLVDLAALSFFRED